MMKCSTCLLLSLLPWFAISIHAQTAKAIYSSSSQEFASSVPGPHSNSDTAKAPGSGDFSLGKSRVSRLGIDAQVGLNGVGGDIAFAVAPHFNLRLGGRFFSYSTSFQEEGADVNASLRLGGGKASLDWYPFHNGFRISPLVVFLNQTGVRATVLVPAGQTISLDDGDYVSSHADPLHGSASIGVRKTSPGLTIGYGNIIPRSGRHLSFPVELGFYYVGQPTLKVAFSGSACDPSQPEPLGCQPVEQDAGFQSDLAGFIRRNNNNLKYASFLPIASFGVGYRF
jgi:hypothetical protein